MQHKECGTDTFYRSRSGIDYTKEDFTRSGQRYDLIIDNVGNHSVSDYKRVLAPNGRCVVIGFSSLSHLMQVMFLGTWVSKTESKKIGFVATKINRDDLLLMRNLIESTAVKPVIDRCYPLSEAADTIWYLEEGHARGKIIITM
jgi:NADPH:quinone reductase-like Zn-dependent oxidoreductase